MTQLPTRYKACPKNNQPINNPLSHFHDRAPFLSTPPRHVIDTKSTTTTSSSSPLQPSARPQAVTHPPAPVPRSPSPVPSLYTFSDSSSSGSESARSTTSKTSAFRRWLSSGSTTSRTFKRIISSLRRSKTDYPTPTPYPYFSIPTARYITTIPRAAGQCKRCMDVVNATGPGDLVCDGCRRDVKAWPWIDEDGWSSKLAVMVEGEVVKEGVGVVPVDTGGLQRAADNQLKKLDVKRRRKLQKKSPEEKAAEEKAAKEKAAKAKAAKKKAVKAQKTGAGGASTAGPANTKPKKHGRNFAQMFTRRK